MKLGDIVICKHKVTIYDSDEFIFYTNKYYLVTDIYGYGNGSSYIQLWNEEYKNVCNVSKPMFDEHFYNLKDIRKMKLDEINEININKI